MRSREENPIMSEVGREQRFGEGDSRDREAVGEERRSKG